jgi:hypothetical protein
MWPWVHRDPTGRSNGAGIVYALDRHPEALQYLLEEADRDVGHVRPMAGDVKALPLRFSQPTATVASLVLHHVDAPKRAIEAVAAGIPETRCFSSSSITRMHPWAAGGTPDSRQPHASVAFHRFTIYEERDLPEGMYAVLGRR